MTDPANRVALTGIEAVMSSKNRSYATLSTLLACVAITGCDLEPDADDDSAGSDENGDDDDAATDPMGDTDEPSDPSSADDDTGSDPDTGSGPDSDSDTSTPGDALGDSVFLYIQQDDSNGDSVRAYDVDTDESWLVTDFGGNTEINGVAIHPDRTSIAVASFYELSDADESEGIWRVPVTGGEPENIMPAMPGENGEFQNVDNLVYSADGEYVWFDHSTSFGGGTVARVADSGGLADLFVDSNGTCAINAAPSPSPDGAQMLTVRNSCSDYMNEGLILYGVPPTDVGQIVIVDSDALGPTFVTPEWASDGSGVLFVAHTPFDIDGDGTNDGDGDSVLFLNFADSLLYTIIPPADEQRIDSFALSPDEGRIILCLGTVTTYDLVLADLTGEAPTYRALTNDGKSCRATW